jgi:hypothetical protein
LCGRAVCDNVTSTPGENLMVHWKRMSAVAAAVLICGVVRAEDAPVAEPDPVRLALAEQVVAAAGGGAQAAILLRSMFGAMQKTVVASAAPEARELIGPMFEDIAQEMVVLTPQLLELSVHAYAQHFTEKELRDLLAFQTSETGRAMVSKLPAVQAQVMSQTMPLVMTVMPMIMRKSVDRMCERKHCTVEQRDALNKVMSRAMGLSAS